MAKKLLEKAGLIHLPPAPVRDEANDTPAEADAAKPKTAPGSMLQFMTAQSAAVKEAESLRERLASYDGALPVRRLNPATVRVSVRPVRVVAAARGVGVGPSNPPAPMLAPVPADPAAVRYEIVFGHRRHRACLELGLPVLALVEDVPEQQLFEEMERENRARADLSAWEQGMMYLRALDQGLYPSNRQLAQAIGRDLGDVGKALSLARLPLSVVNAFRSPMDLQYRWAKPLADAQQRDPDGLVARARALKTQTSQRTAKQVFDTLVQVAAPVLASRVPDIAIRVAGRQVAVVCSDDRGHTLVRFAKGLGDTQRRSLAATLEQYLATQRQTG